MITSIELEDGKYTVTLEEPSENDPSLPMDFYALRNAERWRELIGDKMVYSMFNRIVELQDQIDYLKREMNKEQGDVS